MMSTTALQGATKLSFLLRLTRDDVDDAIWNAESSVVIFRVGDHLIHHLPRLAVVR